MARGRKENLVSISDRATEVQRKIRSAGGKARAEQIRHEKDLRTALKVALGILKNTEKGIELSIAEGMAQKLANEALKGDWKAMQIIIDLLYPKEQKIDHTSSDGSMTPKSGAVFNLDGLTDEQLDALAQQAFTGTK